MAYEKGILDYVDEVIIETGRHPDWFLEEDDI